MRSVKTLIGLVLFIAMFGFFNPAFGECDIIQPLNIPPLTVEHVVIQNSQKEIVCMAQAMYFEARGQGTVGEDAVANVILNRLNDGKFPNSVCGIVYQDCQFAWTCNKSLDKSPKELVVWDYVLARAYFIINQYNNNEDMIDPTNGALYFHERSIKKTRGWKKTAEIGNHIFYTRIAYGNREEARIQ